MNNNEEIKEEQTSNEQVQPYHNERIDKWQEKMNGMDAARRKGIFIKAVLIIIVFLIIKFMIGLSCSRTGTNEDTNKKDTVAFKQDSLELIVDQILGYEFKPTKKENKEIEDVLNELVKQDREEAEQKEKAKARKNGEDSKQK